MFPDGVSLLLYPSVIDWWNARYQSRAITNCSAEIVQPDNDLYEQIRTDAETQDEMGLYRAAPAGWGCGRPSPG